MRALAILAVLALPAATQAQTPDGKALFAARCAACHTPSAAKSSLMAPKIAGAYGRKIASLGDYAYSPALKSKGGQAWTDANLDAYLASPAKWAPGTKMIVGLPAAPERKAVIAYLKTVK